MVLAATEAAADTTTVTTAITAAISPSMTAASAIATRGVARPDWRNISGQQGRGAQRQGTYSDGDKGFLLF